MYDHNIFSLVTTNSAASNQVKTTLKEVGISLSKSMILNGNREGIFNKVQTTGCTHE